MSRTEVLPQFVKGIAEDIALRYSSSPKGFHELSGL